MRVADFGGLAAEQVGEFAHFCVLNGTGDKLSLGMQDRHKPLHRGDKAPSSRSTVVLAKTIIATAVPKSAGSDAASS